MINRPKWYPDESIFSYFQILFRLTRSQLYDDQCVAGKVIQKITWQSRQFRNNILGNTNSYLLKNRMKYCPDCISENLYLRVMWILKPISLC